MIQYFTVQQRIRRGKIRIGWALIYKLAKQDAALAEISKISGNVCKAFRPDRFAAAHLALNGVAAAQLPPIVVNLLEPLRRLIAAQEVELKARTQEAQAAAPPRLRRLEG